MAGSESMSSARRPSRPSSKTWNRPTGPAPTMTASVTVASFVRSGDKGFLQGNRRAPLGRRNGRGLCQILLHEPFRIEKARLILGPAITQDRDDGLAGPHLARHANGSGDVDAARAAEEQAVFMQQLVDGGHRLRVFDVNGAIELRGRHVGSDTRDADAFGDRAAASGLQRTVLDE